MSRLRHPPSDAGPTRIEVDAALARLKQLHPRTIDLGLDRVVRLLDALGAPHRGLPPAIHVAGTNGKGSTLAFLRAFLEEAGHRVHAYTSPHLERFNERIRLAGAPIDDTRLLDVLLRVEQACAGEATTFFEATTAATFLAMAEEPADVVLLETGLGGRLDATNVLDRPAATAITPVGMDHMAYLGDSIERIAAEKAGILKPGIAAVIAPQPAKAAAAIAAQAEAVGAPLYAAGADWCAAAADDAMRYESPARVLHLPRPALPGDHQIVNAGTAIAILDRLTGFAVADEAIARGLRSVEWPGRLQQLTTGRLARMLPTGAELWVDAAHNRQGGEQLARFLSTRRDLPTVLVVGMYYDKQSPEFLANFEGLAERLFALEFTGEQPCQPAERIVAAAADHGIPAEPASGVADAIARLGPAPYRLVVCGSIALIGHVLAENHGRG
ncbi:MAG TPA: folylpolyglutamate synthase/dihydrofolate synthase family protein [Alphaproteobacteria bacterium]|nr:folylpolyglutamate synthase/dihydrofolate synthase family protein [Alphaproteobacteria bacterium]